MTTRTPWNRRPSLMRRRVSEFSCLVNQVDMFFNMSGSLGRRISDSEQVPESRVTQLTKLLAPRRPCPKVRRVSRRGSVVYEMFVASPTSGAVYVTQGHKDSPILQLTILHMEQISCTWNSMNMELKLGLSRREQRFFFFPKKKKQKHSRQMTWKSPFGETRMSVSDKAEPFQNTPCRA